MSKSFGNRTPTPQPRSSRIQLLTLGIAVLAAALAAIFLFTTTRHSTPSPVAPKPLAEAIVTTPATQTADQAVHTDATPSYPVVNPHTHCQGRYPLNYGIRDICIRGQEEAKLTAHSIRIDDDVKTLCAKRYIDDWDMYVVCAKNQMRAKLSEHSKPDRPEFDIIAMCQTKWPEDHSMEEHCIEGQEKARDEARNPSIDDAIAIRCTSKWPTSWEMFMYCVKQQTKARSRLRL